MSKASIRVCVLGSGGFGTALGTVIARNGFQVTLLTRREEVAEAINTQHKNPSHLSEFKLPPLLAATTSAEEALEKVSFIIHAIPVQSTDAFLEPLIPLIPPEALFISTSKGLHSETLETMAEIVPRVLGRPQPMAFMSGPTFAKELMDMNPSGCVVAASDQETAEKAASVFHCNYLTCYTSTDVIGVEIGGALKNVYALGAGAVEGMGLGSNTLAFLVTIACTEMNMVAVSLGAAPNTMSSLAGIGDLMLTCMGGASRNKAVGMRIGKGESLKKILDSRANGLEGVAEGVATAPAVRRLIERHGISAKVACGIAAVIAGEARAKETLLMLMERPITQDPSIRPHILKEPVTGTAEPTSVNELQDRVAQLEVRNAALESQLQALRSEKKNVASN